MKKLYILLLLSFAISSLQAQEATKFEGKWSGELNLGAAKLALIFDVLKQDDGSYTSLLSVPVQQLKGFKMDSTSLVEGKLYTESKLLQMVYEGEYKDESYVGEFRQRGMSFELTLTPYGSEEVKELSRPQTPKEPFPYNQQEVTFINEVEGNRLAGTLTTPSEGGECPAVVLVSGSGSQNRDEELFGHKPFMVIADYLTRNGIAVLRYDDRGVGGSESVNNGGSTTYDIARDAEAAVKYLRGRGEFTSVGVAGHSEGGIIAFMLAGDDEFEMPDFIISMAGTGIRGAEILNRQQEHALAGQSLSQEDIDKYMGINKAVYSLVLDSKEVSDALKSDIKELLYSTMFDEVATEQGRGDIDMVISQVTQPWMYYFLRYDPVKSIELITVPVLAINGTLDTQVLAEDNLGAIQRGLEKGGNGDFEVVEFEGLNHLFQHARTGDVSEYSEIEETISVGVLEKIVSWIVARFE